MVYQKVVEINEELGVEYADSGPWRSYHLYTRGSSREELLAEAAISEIDQDGGELATYDIGEASNEVIDAVEREIDRALQPKFIPADTAVRANANRWAQQRMVERPVIDWIDLRDAYLAGARGDVVEAPKDKESS